MLKPIRNSILFVFTDGTAEGKFVPKTASGIILTNQGTGSQNGCKWGKVVALGPEVKAHIKVGEYILIDEHRWTMGFKHEGVDIWKTDETQVLAVTTDIADTYQF